MAVCNIFTELNKPTGNFLMFSNYTEDICKYSVFDSNYRVVPSKFYALDVDFPKKLSELQQEISELQQEIEELEERSIILSNEIGAKEDELKQLIDGGAEQEEIERCEEELAELKSQRSLCDTKVAYNEAKLTIYKNPNKYIPRKFQNRYENWLALQKNGVFEDSSFNPAGALWHFLYGIGLLDLVGYVKNNDKDVVDENLYDTNIVYEGTINLESYDLHNDTGYAEIVCHIPSETSAKTYSMRPGTSAIIKIDKNYIEGFEGDDTYALDEDDKEVNYFTNINTTKGLELEATNNSNTKYKFNTIVVCYDVYEGGTLKYTGLPLGVYFMGLFNGATMENEKTIYIANGDAFGASTTYTLRICTRFTPSTSSDKLGTVVDDDNANLGYLLSKLADSMNTVEEILKNAHTDNVTLKDTLNIIKNNRTNVPYLVSGGENTPQYWYVNGKCISEVPIYIATSQEVDKTFNEVLGV